MTSDGYTLFTVNDAEWCLRPLIDETIEAGETWLEGMYVRRQSQWLCV